MHKLVMILVSIILFIFFALAVSAEVPNLISYQGLLIDDAGNPVDTTVDLTFRIWDAPTVGTAVWSEKQSEIVIIDGLFNVNLGAVTAFGTTFTGSTMYLSVQMGDGLESNTRIPMISVPYALYAEHADTAAYAHTGPGVSENGWIDDGTTVRLDNIDDSVGIGISTPTTKLDVVSDGTSIRGSTTGGSGYTGVLGMAGDGTGVYGLGMFGTGVHGFSSTGFAGYFEGPVSYFSSRVGIGVESPRGALDISQNSDEVCLHFINGTRDITWMPAHALQIGQWDGTTWTERMRISSNGNVGIGVSNPGAGLEVDGGLKVTGEYSGTISSSSGSDGAPFPKPAYDSGWEPHLPSGNLVLTHNIGGNVDDYVVDLQFKDDEDWGINTFRYGGSLDGIDAWGGCWGVLTDSTILIKWLLQHDHIDHMRVRIWVVQ